MEQKFNAGQYKFEVLFMSRHRSFQSESDDYQIEPTVFSMATYTTFIKAVAEEVAQFTEKRADAVARVGARWDANTIRDSTPFKHLFSQRKRTASRMVGSEGARSIRRQYR